MDISVLIDQGLETAVDAGRLTEVARGVLAAESAGDGVELGLVVTGQERIRQLNRDYRGRDEPTDVLAFAAREEADGQSPFVQPPDGVLHLGEVIISLPQAAAQAGERGHSLEKELAVLVIHGVLHLLGYDHEEAADERRMQAREAEILGEIEGGLV